MGRSFKLAYVACELVVFEHWTTTFCTSPKSTKSAQAQAGPKNLNQPSYLWGDFHTFVPWGNCINIIRKSATIIIVIVMGVHMYQTCMWGQIVTLWQITISNSISVRLLHSNPTNQKSLFHSALCNVQSSHTIPLKEVFMVKRLSGPGPKVSVSIYYVFSRSEFKLVHVQLIRHKARVRFRALFGPSTLFLNGGTEILFTMLAKICS